MTDQTEVTLEKPGDTGLEVVDVPKYPMTYKSCYEKYKMSFIDKYGNSIFEGEGPDKRKMSREFTDFTYNCLNQEEAEKFHNQFVMRNIMYDKEGNTIIEPETNKPMLRPNPEFQPIDIYERSMMHEPVFIKASINGKEETYKITQDQLRDLIENRKTVADAGEEELQEEIKQLEADLDFQIKRSEVYDEVNNTLCEGKGKDSEEIIDKFKVFVEEHNSLVDEYEKVAKALTEIKNVKANKDPKKEANKDPKDPKKK